MTVCTQSQHPMPSYLEKLFNSSMEVFCQLFDIGRQTEMQKGSHNKQCSKIEIYDDHFLKGPVPVHKILLDRSGPEGPQFWKSIVSLRSLTVYWTYNWKFISSTSVRPYLINILRWIWVATESITAKQYILQKFLFQWICCKCLAW